MVGQSPAAHVTLLGNMLDGSHMLTFAKNKKTNCNYDFAFGGFPAELGPETRSNGSGPKNAAERTHN